MTSRFRIEPLGAHDRSMFSSGDSALDRYFREVVGQDVRRRAARAFVAAEQETHEIAGFYTLSAAAVNRDALPQHLAEQAPKYLRVPAVLLGRLAVASNYQGQGLGEVLLFDALMRAARSDLGIYAMIVDPKNEQASAFYRRYGFEPTDTNPVVLFLPLAAARTAT